MELRRGGMVTWRLDQLTANISIAMCGLGEGGLDVIFQSLW